MLLSQHIQDYLHSHDISYELVAHPQAFAAQEVARRLAVPDRQFAKAIVLHADGRLVMAVLPASRRLNFHKLKDALEVKHLEMAPETELAGLCPDCDLGAFPPFGNLYGMDVWVDRRLAESAEIVFNAGSHTEAVRMKYSDYLKLTKAQIGSFAEEPPA